MKKYVVEFIGTFFLLFTIINAVASAGALAPLAIGAMLMVMVYAGGPISGAHYNPAVTIAVWLRGKCDAKDIFPYIVAQVAGASIAAIITTSLMGIPVGNGMEVEIMPALLAEILGTFALAYVILNVATSSKSDGNSYFGLAIGFTVATLAFSVGSISGGVFNPAVAVGGSLAGLLSWGLIWVYLIANFAGGIAAAFVFKYVDSED